MNRFFAKISIIFLLLVLFSSCYKDITYTNLETAKFSSKNEYGNIILYIKLNNPNFYSVQIVESDLNLYLNDTHLGEIKGDYEIKIPSKTETIIELPLKIKLTDLIFNVGNVINLIKNKDTKISVNGSITGKAFFFKNEVDINEETNISLY